MANNPKMVVLTLVVIAPHLPDDAVPLMVADAVRVRGAVGDRFQVQQFQVAVMEHTDESALPGETVPNKARMN